MSSDAIFTCSVPGVPIPQGRPRVSTIETKSGRRFGKARYSSRSCEYRDLLVYSFRQARRARPTIMEPFGVVVLIAGCSHRSDIDNIAKQIVDALVTAAVIPTDRAEYLQSLAVRIVEGDPHVTVSVAELGVARYTGPIAPRTYLERELKRTGARIAATFRALVDS